MLKKLLIGLTCIFSASLQAAPMTFSLEGTGGNCQYGCHWIMADGEITQNTASDYQKFIEGLNHVPILVYLNGYGKDVIASLELGRLFR